jgi:hypothetical protein
MTTNVAEDTLSTEAAEHIAQQKRHFAEAARLAHEELDKWDRIEEAAEQEKSPTRDRMVVTDDGKEFIATFRWEINWRNGFVTVQLADGSIMPFQYGKWCLYGQAVDHFEIERSQIRIDDPREEQ